MIKGADITTELRGDLVWVTVSHPSLVQDVKFWTRKEVWYEEWDHNKSRIESIPPSQLSAFVTDIGSQPRFPSLWESYKYQIQERRNSLSFTSVKFKHNDGQTDQEAPQESIP